MPGEPRVLYRFSIPADSVEVAILHSDSWRRHYRGAYSNTYLDGDVVADRLEVWAGRMAEPRDDRFTIVAEIDSRIVGFVHTVLDTDPVWGSLIDNLHVTSGLERRRIGSSLLQGSTRIVSERSPSSGIYLWVLEQNAAAQQFYAAGGGHCVERDVVAPPGGDPTRLSGHPFKLRYAWPNPDSVAFQ